MSLPTPHEESPNRKPRSFVPRYKGGHGKPGNPGDSVIPEKSSPAAAYKKTRGIDPGTVVDIIGKPISLTLALVLLTFTEIPLPLRFLGPILLLLAFPRFSKGAEKWILIAVALTVYECVIGSLFVFFTGTGSVLEACYPPLRGFVCGVAVIFALKGASVRTLVLVILIWGGLQSWAVVTERLGGSAVSLIPFPVYSAEHAKNIMNATTDRVRGFTAESGVVGGMAAVLLLLVFLCGILEMRKPKSKFKQSRLFALGLAAAPLLVASSLTLTKSSVFVLVAAFLVFFVVALFKEDWRSVFTCLVSVSGVCILFSAYVLTQPSVANYVENETAAIKTLLQTRSLSDISNSGLATRLGGFQLTLLGVQDYPLGLGNAGFETYLAKNLDKVEMSQEMQGASGVEMLGPKSYLLNSVIIGGIPGVLLLLWVFSETTKPFAFASKTGFKPMRASLAAGILALSLSAELLPFMGFCALVYCVGLAFNREYLESRSPLPNSAPVPS